MAVILKTYSPGTTIRAGIGIENRYTSGYYFCFGFHYYSDKIGDWVGNFSDWVWVNGQTSIYLGSLNLTIRSDETKGWKAVCITLVRWDGSKAVIEDQICGLWIKVV